MVRGRNSILHFFPHGYQIIPAPFMVSSCFLHCNAIFIINHVSVISGSASGLSINSTGDFVLAWYLDNWQAKSLHLIFKSILAILCISLLIWASAYQVWQNTYRVLIRISWLYDQFDEFTYLYIQPLNPCTLYISPFIQIFLMYLNKVFIVFATKASHLFR